MRIQFHRNRSRIERKLERCEQIDSEALKLKKKDNDE